MSAKLLETTNPDWVPTLNMCNKEIAGPFSEDPLDVCPSEFNEFEYTSCESNELETSSLGDHDINKVILYGTTK